MNRELLESQWIQIREILRDKFNNLSEEDIRQINGRYDQLVDKLQQKYGYTREEAEDRIRSWNFDRYAVKGHSAREEYVKKEDNTSLLKWIVGLGLPLLLLGLYLFSPAMNETTVSPGVTQEQMTAETPAERAISSNVRNAILAQNFRGFDISDVQITTHNGIVTLTGTVPSTQIRDSIVRTTQNTAGVRQVVNNLQLS